MRDGTVERGNREQARLRFLHQRLCIAVLGLELLYRLVGDVDLTFQVIEFRVIVD